MTIILDIGGDRIFSEGTAIIDIERPFINGVEVDYNTWKNVVKIVTNSCMRCFPIHYPALYFRLFIASNNNLNLHADKAKEYVRMIRSLSRCKEDESLEVDCNECPCKCH